MHIINRREKKAVRARNYVKAQYHKIEHMKRQIAIELIDLEIMTARKRTQVFNWNAYSHTVEEKSNLSLN
jgi:hypothetical protein